MVATQAPPNAPCARQDNKAAHWPLTPSVPNATSIGACLPSAFVDLIAPAANRSAEHRRRGLTTTSKAPRANSAFELLNTRNRILRPWSLLLADCKRHSEKSPARGTFRAPFLWGKGASAREPSSRQRHNRTRSTATQRDAGSPLAN
jgi:hypothetical protein